MSSRFCLIKLCPPLLFSYHLHGMKYLFLPFSYQSHLPKCSFNSIKQIQFLFVIFVVAAVVLILWTPQKGDRVASSLVLHCEFPGICSSTFDALKFMPFNHITLLACLHHSSLLPCQSTCSGKILASCSLSHSLPQLLSLT